MKATRETFTILEAIADQRLLELEAALSHFVGLQAVRLLHFLIQRGMLLQPLIFSSVPSLGRSRKSMHQISDSPGVSLGYTSAGVTSAGFSSAGLPFSTVPGASSAGVSSAVVPFFPVHVLVVP